MVPNKSVCIHVHCVLNSSMCQTNTSMIKLSDGYNNRNSLSALWETKICNDRSAKCRRNHGRTDEVLNGRVERELDVRGNDKNIPRFTTNRSNAAAVECVCAANYPLPRQPSPSPTNTHPSCHHHLSISQTTFPYLWTRYSAAHPLGRSAAPSLTAPRPTTWRVSDCWRESRTV